MGIINALGESQASAKPFLSPSTPSYAQIAQRTTSEDRPSTPFYPTLLTFPANARRQLGSNDIRRLQLRKGGDKRPTFHRSNSTTARGAQGTVDQLDENSHGTHQKYGENAQPGSNAQIGELGVGGDWLLLRSTLLSLVEFHRNSLPCSLAGRGPGAIPFFEPCPLVPFSDFGHRNRMDRSRCHDQRLRVATGNKK